LFEAVHFFPSTMNLMCFQKRSTPLFRRLERVQFTRLKSGPRCANGEGSLTQAISKSFHQRCVAALLVGVLSIPGIQSSYAADAKKPVVGLVMKSLANEFFKDMQEGAIKHVAQRGDLTLLPVGMHSETDIDTQVNAVETFITKKVDAIVIAPADSRALVAPLARAIKAGIVVVNIDVALDEKAKKQAGISLAFVGPDNRAGAKLAGDELARALGKGGKVVIIEGNPGADNAQQRKIGFDDAVKAGKLELIDSRTAHWETEEANSVFSNMLTAHPDIQGVMAANDSMALGVIKAIDASGKSGKIKVVGFDNIPAVQPLLKEKKLLATVDQFGSQMAANGIDYAMKALAGEKLHGWIKTPIELVVAPGS
jgi:ribose transport system substrate-binding protein